MRDDHDALDDMSKEIRASDFKAPCLALLDDVADHRAEYVITKRGRPLSRLVPIARPASIHGSARILTKDESDLLSTGETWSAEQ